jgi:transaldolase
MDDRGINGMDFVRNIKTMYESGDHHVHILAASLRRQEHLLYAFALQAELATAPAKVLEQWAASGLPVPGQDFQYKAVDAAGKELTSIPYKQLDLNASWTEFDIRNELTAKGIEKFVSDYKSTLASAA